MFRKIITLVVIVIHLTVTFHALAAEELVDFHSKAVEDQIRIIIDKPEGDIIPNDLSNIKYLRLSGITNNGGTEMDVELLKFFPYLRGLDIDTPKYCTLTQYNMINELTNLEELSLSFYPWAYSAVGSVPPLSKLHKLKNLSLYKIHTFSNSAFGDFEGLEKLETLTIYANDIGELTSIGKLISLKRLSFYIMDGKNIDLSFLKDLKSLRELQIGWGQGELDLTPLSQLSELEALTINSVHYDSSSALGNLSKLKNLTIAYNNNSDWGVFERLTNLEKLTINCTNVNNENNLKHLKNLQHLNSLSIQSSSIVDVDSLAALINLEYLNLLSNNISDITPLKNLVNLKELNLGFNAIQDITPLEELIKLERLQLYNNEISSISPLSNMANLTELNLSDNRLINDITPLKNLDYIHKLGLNNTNVYDLTPLGNRIYTIELESNQGAFMGNYFNSDIVTYLEGNPIPSYNIGGYTVIVVEDLENYGYDMMWKPSYSLLRADFNKDKPISPIDFNGNDYAHNLGTISGNVYFNEIRTFIDLKHHDISDGTVPTLNIGGRTVVSVENLAHYGYNVKWNPVERSLYITREENKAITPIKNIDDINIPVAKVPLGDIVYSDIVTTLNGFPVPNFNIGGQTVILYDVAKNYGFNIIKNAETLDLEYDKKKSLVPMILNNNLPKPQLGTVIGQAYSYGKKVYIEINPEYQPLYGYNTQDNHIGFIAESLPRSYFNVSWDKTNLSLDINYKDYYMLQLPNSKKKN